MISRPLRNGKYIIVLSWLNDLGGVETTVFTAQKSYGINIDSSSIAERDVFRNWDSSFSSSLFDHDLVSVKSRERLTVRSQRLNEDQSLNIRKIKTSLQIVDVIRNVQVRIDRSSWTTYNEGDKTSEISFTIEYPNDINITL